MVFGEFSPLQIFFLDLNVLGIKGDDGGFDAFVGVGEMNHVPSTTTFLSRVKLIKLNQSINQLKKR